MQIPFLAFFSKRLYRDIGRNWKGVNLAYLFLLLAICCVPFALHKRAEIVQSLETNQVDILNQVPEIHILNGEAYVEAEMPYFIKNHAGKPIAIIDTTGSMNYIDDPSVQVMLTANKLIIRRGRTLFNKFDLDAVEDLYIDKHVLNGWISGIKGSIAPLSYGIFLMLSYIFAVMAMTFVAIIGLILSNIMHSALSFKDTMRIAVTASTPAIIGLTVSAALGLSIPLYVFLAITLAYLLMGILSCSSNIEDREDGDIDLKAALRPDAQAVYEEAA